MNLIKKKTTIIKWTSLKHPKDDYRLHYWAPLKDSYDGTEYSQAEQNNTQYTVKISMCCFNASLYSMIWMNK